MEKQNTIAKFTLSLPNKIKLLVLVIADILICFGSSLISIFVRTGSFSVSFESWFMPAGLSVILLLPLLSYFGLYREILRFTGDTVKKNTAKAVFIYAILASIPFLFIGVSGVPRTMAIIQPFFLYFFITSFRVFSSKFVVTQDDKRPKEKFNLLIIGCGSRSAKLVKYINLSPKFSLKALIDESGAFEGRSLNGCPVFKSDSIERVVKIKRITHVLLAFDEQNSSQRINFLNRLQGLNVCVQNAPELDNLAEVDLQISDFGELELNDLLGRRPTQPIPHLMEKNIYNKVVLVTGAGGSIGSELCRQITLNSPKKIILFEQNEFGLYSIEGELKKQNNESQAEIISVLGSIQDRSKIRKVLEEHTPDTIYHAAAYKHVPLVETNIVEGLRNNVFGTLNLVLSSLQSSVSNFVLISTDKAVRPTNVMGASKRVSELILQALAETKPEITFTMVRFGNVLGSSGSVVPKFRQQIKDGGPITLTHPDVTRYFMTIREAAQLVIQSGAMAEGGEVFVLDMGKPIKIKRLAEKMIMFAGLSVKDDTQKYGQIEISVTGLRPGEKLFEELLVGKNPQKTSHERIMKAEESFLAWSELQQRLESLEEELINEDLNQVLLILEELVEGFSYCRESLT